MKYTNEEIKNHHIKLTANDILNKYNAKKKTFHFNFKRFFMIATPVAASIILVVPLAIHLNDVEVKKVIPSNEVNERFVFSFMSSVYLLNSNKTAQPKAKMLLTFNNEDLENEEDNENPVTFDEIVSVYDPIDDMIWNEVYNDSNDFSQLIESEYQGKYGTYKYSVTTTGQMESTIYLNYIKDNSGNVDISGETLINGLIYRVEGEKKVSPTSNKEELSVKTYLNEDNYVQVEETYKMNKYSYSFERVENDETVYEFEYDKKENFITVELTEKEIEYEFKIKYLESPWIVEYEFPNNKGSFSITRNNGEKVYKDLITLKEIKK